MRKTILKKIVNTSPAPATHTHPSCSVSKIVPIYIYLVPAVYSSQECSMLFYISLRLYFYYCNKEVSVVLVGKLEFGKSKEQKV